ACPSGSVQPSSARSSLDTVIDQDRRLRSSPSRYHVEYPTRIVRHSGSTPGNVLIGPQQREWPLIKLQYPGVLNRDDLKWNRALRRRTLETRRARRIRAQPQEAEAAPQT